MDMTRHPLPALVLGKLRVLEQQLERRPNGRGRSPCAVHRIRAKRKPSADRLVNVYHCKRIRQRLRSKKTPRAYGSRKTRT